MHTTSRNSLGSGVPEQTERDIFRQYYAENDFILSPEGILKVLSVVVCIVCAVGQLSAGGGACAAVLAGGVASCACACTGALLYVAVVLRVPLCAPQLCLYMLTVFTNAVGGICSLRDLVALPIVRVIWSRLGNILHENVFGGISLLFDIIFSSVIGVLLLIMAVLTMSSCHMDSIAEYMLGPLCILSAGMVISSAVFTYVSVMRLWDKSHIHHEPQRPNPEEQDV